MNHGLKHLKMMGSQFKCKSVKHTLSTNTSERDPINAAVIMFNVTQTAL